MIDIIHGAFQFREDGTYKFMSMTFAGEYIYRGNYSLNDSLIILSDWEDISLDKEIRKVIKMKILAIRYSPTSESDLPKLYQINSNHDILEGTTVFSISIDRRM